MVQARSLAILKMEIDKYVKDCKIEGCVELVQDSRPEEFSRDQTEWQGMLKGPSGLLLFLFCCIPVEGVL